MLIEEGVQLTNRNLIVETVDIEDDMTERSLKFKGKQLRKQTSFKSKITFVSDY